MFSTNSFDQHLPLSKFTLALLLIAILIFPACKKPAEKRYPLTGRVIAIDLQHQSAIIDSDDIPGFMQAMAMGYKFKNAQELKQLKAGDAISADVVVVEHDYWLENVRVTKHGSTAPEKTGAAGHLPSPGDEVPNFIFTNQDGRRVHLDQYRGKILLLTFIYTRCPFPDFCPRVSRNFAEIYHQLQPNATLAPNVHLLSISFDPEHDTPRALRQYAFSVAGTKQASLFKQWEFVVPNQKDLPQIAQYFDLIYDPDGGVITHTLSTAVIGPDGKIVNWYHGSDWQPSDLLSEIHHTASAS